MGGRTAAGSAPASPSASPRPPRTQSPLEQHGVLDSRVFSLLTRQFQAIRPSRLAARSTSSRLGQSPPPAAVASRPTRPSVREDGSGADSDHLSEEDLTQPSQLTAQEHLSARSKRDSPRGSHGCALAHGAQPTLSRRRICRRGGRPSAPGGASQSCYESGAARWAAAAVARRCAGTAAGGVTHRFCRGAPQTERRRLSDR